MDNLLAARSQMALSLGFHIVFASIGMVMPVIMAFTHWRWLRTGRQVYKDLTKAWSRGVAIFFATGAVSGTLLSFELGLLWPTFMEHAGPIFGMPFSLEGTAFFLEAIALGLFLYGWERLNKWFHWFTGLMVGVTGLASGVLVIAANAWMNSPTGFDYENGKFFNIDPVAAMFNDAWFHQAHHMIFAAFVATSFAVAGIHAFMLLKYRKNEFHLMALKITMGFASLAIIAQMISADFMAKDVAKRQPIKLAAMEAHFVTQKGAPILIGGIPDVENKTVRFAIKIPSMLSFLAYGDFNAEVKGLEDFPREEWPPVPVVHIAFQIMVGAGSTLLLVAFVYLLAWWRFKDWITKTNFLRMLVCCTPLGFIALEAGWVVTEVGRQPWIIYGIMKTADAVTPMPGLTFSLGFYIIIYALLSLMVSWLMVRQISTVHIHYPSAHDQSKGETF